MNADKLTTLLAQLLIILLAEGEDREGPLYARLMNNCTAEEFQTLLFVAAETGMVLRGSNFLVKITCKGRGFAYKIKKALDAITLPVS